MKCIAIAHHTLAHDWSNILATIANAEWLVRSVLCVIDSSQQTTATGLCVLFVKGISAWIIIECVVEWVFCQQSGPGMLKQKVNQLN